jgi:hypothetical protein
VKGNYSDDLVVGLHPTAEVVVVAAVKCNYSDDLVVGLQLTAEEVEVVNV